MRPGGPGLPLLRSYARPLVTQTANIIATAGMAVDLAACLDHRGVTPAAGEPAPLHRPRPPRLAAAPPGPRR